MESKETKTKGARKTIFERDFLFGILEKSDKKAFEERFSDLEDEITRISKFPKHVVKKSLANFKYRVRIRKKYCNILNFRTESRNKEWLKGKERIQDPDQKIKKTPHPQTSKAVRLRKNFSDYSEKSKRRKTVAILKEYSAEELTFAATKKNLEEKNFALARVIKIASRSKTAAEEVLTKIKSTIEPVKKASLDEAVTLLEKGNFTVSQWNLISQFGPKKLPSYYTISRWKKQCQNGENVDQEETEEVGKDPLAFAEEDYDPEVQEEAKLVTEIEIEAESLIVNSIPIEFKPLEDPLLDSAVHHGQEYIYPPDFW